MTGEEMERAIEFLLEHDSRFTEAIDRVIGAIDQLTGIQATTSTEIQELKNAQAKTVIDLQSLTGKVVELTENVSRSEQQAETDRQEMREAINNLIVANEVTRNLTETVAQLAITTSRRVTALEDRLQ